MLRLGCIELGHRRLPLGVAVDEDDGVCVFVAAAPAFASGLEDGVVVVVPPGPMLPKPRLWKSSLSIRLLGDHKGSIGVLLYRWERDGAGQLTCSSCIRGNLSTMLDISRCCLHSLSST
jgi:hypothetical protein